ncbi:hypothetical protein [Fretibacter rubidus]|uniref:hypothetical protein n=1 Tax=Fretibacter rubidus TaxID=570162 RepID=UPI00352A4296
MDRGRDDTRPLYPHNRTTQRRGARFAARAVPPARNYAPFYQYAARGLSPTQFMERLCRLSVHGRISVYRMIYWSSRMVREAVMAMFTRGDFRMADGVWDAHSVPD